MYSKSCRNGKMVNYEGQRDIDSLSKWVKTRDATDKIPEPPNAMDQMLGIKYIKCYC